MKNVRENSKLTVEVLEDRIAPGMVGTPPGQLGYEGQPGNQGGFHQAGQQSYEGQLGNQSGNGGN